MRILIFGDSITYGAWDSEGGWAERLKRWAHRQYLEDGTKLQVINLGIGGNTSQGILARMENEIKARHSASWPFMIILMFGSNDGRVRDGVVEVPLDEFSTNYREIVKIAQSYTDRLVTVGLPPLGQPEIDFKEMQYSDVTLESYDSRIRTIADENGLPFVDVRPLFASKDAFSPDLLHPNDKGHEIIYEAVKAEVEKLVG